MLQQAVENAVRRAGLARSMSCHTLRFSFKTRLPKALPFCHVTLKGQKPLPPGYPKELKTLGDQLRKRRMDFGISQRELAKRIGVSKSSIENWEGNEAEPARWMVPRIREFLGLQPSGPPTSFAERLTAYRRGLGLSQEAL
ncbi:MAG: helix-turn-helix domain-containing protein, partial [Candidatus Rokubacteria bacterium]|nr:helix-turn-helix domain-containing protein [Candidatus Rokubacteria bacterium]